MTYRQKASATAPGVNQLISQDTSGGFEPVVQAQAFTSGDGRYVLFSSTATNIVTGDTNGQQDVFRRDTVNGATVRVSKDSSGNQLTYGTIARGISYNGQYALYSDPSDNLYLRDVVNGTTTTVVNQNGPIRSYVSGDGRYVAFEANGNIVTGFNPPFNNIPEIYIEDMDSGAVKPVSADASGNPANNPSSLYGVSCDGTVLTFETVATNLGVGAGLYLADVGWNATDLTRVNSNPSQYTYPQLSCDGSVVAYGVNPSSAAYEYNRLSGAVKSIGLKTNGTAANVDKLSISDDGRYVAFTSADANVDTAYSSTGAGSMYDVYAEDTKTNTTQLVSFTVAGNMSGLADNQVSLSTDGSEVSYVYNTPTGANSSQELISGVHAGASSQPGVYESETGF